MTNEPRKRPRNAHVAKRKQLEDADKLATRREAATIAAYTVKQALAEREAYWRDWRNMLHADIQRLREMHESVWWRRAWRWVRRVA